MKANSEVIKIALIQGKAFDDVEKNIERTMEKIKAAAHAGAKIVCTQELFATKYFPQTQDYAAFDLAEKIPGPTTEKLSKTAKENGVIIIASLFEKRAQGVYHNTAVVFNEKGELIHKYRKMHIPHDPGFEEKYYFTPGDLGFSSVQTSVGRLGVLVCWDQWFPEAARLTALSGAQIIFYPTTIGWGSFEKPQTRREQLNAWKIMHQSHSIANGVFVAAANRVGVEGDKTFWGNSIACDPAGNIIANASADKEEILYAECDLHKIEEQRKGRPFLRDRRIDFYQDLSRRLKD